MIGMHKNSALRYKALRGFPGYLWEVALLWGRRGGDLYAHATPASLGLSNGNYILTTHRTRGDVV